MRCEGVWGVCLWDSGGSVDVEVGGSGAPSCSLVLREEISCGSS